MNEALNILTFKLNLGVDLDRHTFSRNMNNLIYNEMRDELKRLTRDKLKRLRTLHKNVYFT